MDKGFAKSITAGVVLLMAVTGMKAKAITPSASSAEPLKRGQANIDTILEKPGDTDSTGYRSLRHTLDSLRKADHVSGLSAAIVSLDSILWKAGLGWANREDSIKVTPQTLFRGGSTSKTFIALALMQLVEEGRISLQDTVRKIAPELKFDNPWASTDPVKVIHLLEHTAGLDDMHFKKLFNRTLPDDISALEGLNAKTDARPIRWRPGTRHSYSNPGYTMAGHLIHKVTGKPFDSYIQSAVFKPLDMSHSGFTLTDTVKQQLAKPYSGPNYNRLSLLPIYLRPSGSLITSATQMSHLVQLLLNDGSYEGKSLLSDSTVERMERPESSIAASNGLINYYGKGLYISDVNGWEMMGHDGGMPGFQASFRYSERLKRGFVIMINGNAGMGDYKEAVTNHISRGQQPPQPPSAIDVPTDSLRRYTGYYAHKSPRNEVMRFLFVLLNGAQVSMQEDSLYIQQGLFGQNKKLIPVDNHLFRIKNDPGPRLMIRHTERYGNVIADRQAFHVETYDGYPLIFKILIFGIGGILALTLLISTFWLIYALYARVIADRESFGGLYLSNMLLPFAAISVMVGGVLSLSFIEGVHIGDPVWPSIFFTASTVIFALLSIAAWGFALYSMIRKEKAGWTRWYGLVSSTALIILTAYLGYWGIIGLKLWAY